MRGWVAIAASWYCLCVSCVAVLFTIGHDGKRLVIASGEVIAIDGSCCVLDDVPYIVDESSRCCCAFS